MGSARFPFTQLPQLSGPPLPALWNAAENWVDAHRGRLYAAVAENPDAVDTEDLHRDALVFVVDRLSRQTTEPRNIDNYLFVAWRKRVAETNRHQAPRDARVSIEKAAVMPTTTTSGDRPAPNPARLARLTPRQRQFCSEFLEFPSFPALAAVYDCSVDSLRRRAKRIVRRLES